MKIICESCTAQYDVDEGRVPASGLHMKCQACLHEFVVQRASVGAGAGAGPALPPGPRLIDLPDDDDVDLPAPKAAPPQRTSKPSLPAIPVPPKPTFQVGNLGDDDADLVAPVSRKVTRSSGPVPVLAPVSAATDDARFDLPDSGDEPELPAPRAARAEQAELPAPKTTKLPAKPATPRPLVEEDLVELPAPRAARSEQPELPAPRGTRSEQPELPAPRSAVPRSTTAPALPRTPPTPARVEQPELPAPRGLSKAELPAPRATPSQPELPVPRGNTPTRPVSPPVAKPMVPPPAPPPMARPAPPTQPWPAPSPPSLVDDSVALPGLRNETTAALDAPDEEDLLLAPRGQMPSVDLDLDLVAPRAELPMPLPQEEVRPERIDLVAPRAELMAPRPAPPIEIDVVAPKIDGQEPPAETMDVAPKAKQKGKPQPIAPEPVAASADVAAPKPRRAWRIPAIAGGVLVSVVALVGVGLGIFTSNGFFGSKLWGGKHAESQARVVTARKLLGDDTLSSYRKAAVDLRLLGESEPSLYEAGALEATARLTLARMGLSAEVKAAMPVVDRLEADPKAAALPETQRVQALRLLVQNKLVEARNKVKPLLQAAPTDAASLTLLAAIEDQAGNLTEAQAAYTKAVALEPNRVQALMGAARSAERGGDLKKAAELFGRALARSPQHFGAQVGLIRVGDGDAAAQKKLDELVQSQSAKVAPRELADGWATLGQLALKAGRFDEAEDRLKRSLGLDPEARAPRFLLARLQCEAGRCKEALAALQKLIATDAKNDRIRTLLARALLETGSAAEAQKIIEPLVGAKDAETLFVRGRVMAATNQPDKAVTLLRDAVAADGTLFPAYLALAKTQADLGKPEEAAATLKQAEQKALGDAKMLIELGQAYQRLGNFTSAESLFRAALAKESSTVARFGLGEALDAQGKDEEAGQVYAQIAADAPDTAGLAEHQARVLARRGKKAEAWELYSKALGAGVPPANLRLAAADVALELGKVKEARALADAVLKEDERSSHARVVIAKVLAANNQYSDALVEARRAAALADLPEAHLLIGSILEHLNRLDQAVLEYNQARRGSSEGEAMLGRARILVHMGATRDALVELSALAKNPRLRGAALLLLGDSYNDLNQRDKARRAYEDAVKAAPENAEPLFKLGRALVDAGKKKDALPVLERSLKLGGDKTAWAPEAYMLVGDAHRELKDGPAAIKAYQRYLEVAPPEASPRNEAKRYISLLGGAVKPPEP